MRQPVAATGRTYLRRPTAGDRDAFLTRARASADHLHPWIHPATDARSFRAYLARGDRLDVEQYLVCRRADDGIAGMINLNNIVRGGLQQAFVGWAAFAPHHGQGHLTDAVGLAARIAFTMLGLHRLEANIQPGNERSRALARRAGFRMEGYSPRYLKVGGEWRDHERWALLEDEWRAEHRGARRH